MTVSDQPADAARDTWVERAPAAVQPYLRLSRFDRPIGFWLLAIPCFQGQLLGRIGEGVGHLDLMLAGLFALGAVAMRGAGCTFNDIIDRDIDAQVARTAARPLPAGHVSVRGAWAWLGAQLLVGLAVLLCLPTPSQITALCALPLVAAYPFMKRITWWPQVWLGLTFNWGVLVGYAAVEGRIDAAAITLFAAAALWTVGYDTIYALQDKEDDALVGVRSTARLFADAVRAWVRGLYLGAIALAGAAMALASAPAYAFLILWPYARDLLRQAASVTPTMGEHALGVFKANRETGLILTAGLFAAAVLPQIAGLLAQRLNP
jgi:4-hydroxybenzoate polyprenyltransferase